MDVLNAIACALFEPVGNSDDSDKWVLSIADESLAVSRFLAVVLYRWVFNIKISAILYCIE